jgi:SAM-dependent methyltransferase
MHAALQRLILAGFTEENLCRFWRVPVVSDVRYVPAPPPEERPRRGLGAWFALLVAGETVPVGALGKLDEWQPWIERDRDRARARVSLIPIAGALVASDRLDATDADAVSAPDLSAVNVAHCLPARLDGKRVLDVGCGAGLLSLCAALRGAHVVGGDVHAAALDFARRNTAGLPVEIVESDLFASVTGSFDLILFNAPLLRAPLAQSGDSPSRYTQSPRGEELALAFLSQARAPEILLHAQLTPALDEALHARARDAAVVQVIFARAPDGTPHALTSIRGDGPAGSRRIEVPLSRFCPHLSRPILEGLHRTTGTLWTAAPWLELRDTRRIGHPPDRALTFGAHTIDAMDLALLERQSVDSATLDGESLERLYRLAALGLLIPAQGEVK